jgi:acetyl-CoA synthetase
MITPERFNLAEAICKRHADAVTRVALLDVKPAASNTYTYGGLDFISDKFAAALSLCGVAEGDAVAVIVPQSAALVTAHLGALKAGAAVLPLSPPLDGAIEQALRDSSAKAVVADFSIRAGVAAMIGGITCVEHLFIAGDNREASEGSYNAKSFWREVHEASADFTAAETLSSAPAFIFRPDGHGGRPRFVVRSHGSLAGEFAAFEKSDGSAINGEPVPLMAAGWPSYDGLLGILYPALWHGRAVTVTRT